MNFDKHIINEFAADLGITIDWAENDIFTQIMDIITRFQSYYIILYGLFIVVGLIMILSFVHFSNTLKKDRKFSSNEILLEKEECTINHKFHQYRRFNGVVSIEEKEELSKYKTIYSIIALIGFIILCYVVPNILQWIIVPEVCIYEMICI